MGRRCCAGWPRYPLRREPAARHSRVATIQPCATVVSWLAPACAALFLEQLLSPVVATSEGSQSYACMPTARGGPTCLLGSWPCRMQLWRAEQQHQHRAGGPLQAEPGGAHLLPVRGGRACWGWHEWQGRQRGQRKGHSTPGADIGAPVANVPRTAATGVCPVWACTQLF